MEHLNAINHDLVEHYRKACQKHPYFADFWTKNSNKFFRRNAEDLKACINHNSKTGEVSTRCVLEAEIFEIYEAITRGDMRQAREEIFDAMAVLIRMIDIIDGVRKFGRPQVERKCNRFDCAKNDSRGVCLRKNGVCSCFACVSFDECKCNIKTNV